MKAALVVKLIIRIQRFVFNVFMWIYKPYLAMQIRHKLA